ncbi:hypothetical protein BBJ29_009237 [Phytophthora kernoviae]|uniref:START domain-containing protein n=1 Tax=Phytophthora kernoviae TaxID=325452 RepID=A0A3F2RCD8_9STRA|nr:hypothetical protein BBP00_00009509 [Phytophthora kernoviae]RLN66064.1 hypothetical protein BBJ29_009237 [Phytophthora kernoviae]
MKTQDVAQWVPQLHLNEQDATSLQELADTLVAHNIDTYNALLVSPDGHADVRRWKELRRKDGIKVYKERSAPSAVPCIPSLLLLGTVVGKLDDVMFVAAAATDEQMKLTSKCLQDGVLDSKVVQSIVGPTEEQPFHHVSVKWRLHNARDYVCVDTTGIVESNLKERVGYSISHSVAFSQIPNFDKLGVERANMSVCCLFRQKTPDTVECYARGFFDFRSDSNELLNSLSMNAVATQWLSFSKYVECSEMKKLVWRMRKNSGLSVNGPMTIEPSDKQTGQNYVEETGGNCNVKRLVCVLAPDRRTVLDKKRTFCTMCVCDVTKSDALAIARDEIHELQMPEEPKERQPQDDGQEEASHEQVQSPCTL